MPKPKITLYVDTVSPFAYMAYYMLRHSPVFKDCDITYVPVFLGGIMKACDNRAPMMIKNKDKWINIERLRWARQFKIPMSEQVPPGFPIPTLAVQRALTALTMTSPDKIPATLDAFFQAFWVDEDKAKAGKGEGMMKCFSDVLGEEEAKKVVEMSTKDEAKKLLLQRGDEAMAEGCFGLPYFVAINAQGQKETYWGFDHFGQVADHLGLDRINADGGWRAML